MHLTGYRTQECCTKQSRRRRRTPACMATGPHPPKHPRCGWRPDVFLLYTCDIEQCLTPETQLSRFADDTTLYSLVQPTDDLQQSTASLQGSFNSLEKWGRKWRICFEPVKTQRMTLNRKPVPPALHQSPLEVKHSRRQIP